MAVQPPGGGRGADARSPSRTRTPPTATRERCLRRARRGRDALGARLSSSGGGAREGSCCRDGTAHVCSSHTCLQGGGTIRLASRRGATQSGRARGRAGRRAPVALHHLSRVTLCRAPQVPHTRRVPMRTSVRSRRTSCFSRPSLVTRMSSCTVKSQIGPASASWSAERGAPSRDQRRVAQRAGAYPTCRAPSCR